MTKSISQAYAAHLAQEVTTLALLFLITRTDGEVFAFTSHDRSIEYGGRTYSPLNAFTPSSVVSSAGMSVDNLDTQAVIDADEITDDDLRAGLFRYADVQIVEVNWEDLTQGARIIRTGNLGEITVNKSGTWVAELRGLMQALQQTYGRIYSRRCDADLGDTRCGFDLPSRTQTGVVTAVASRASFSVNGITDDVFDGGLLTWTSGLNNGVAMEIKRWSGSPSDSVELFDAMYFNVQVGDTFSMSPGCDKMLSTCRDEFNNVVNFRGFNDIPGRDAILKYPDSPA